MEPALSEILCCPATRQSLAPASAELLQRLNQNISAGRVKNNVGVAVTESVLSAWLRDDQAVLYPIRNHISSLLAEEGIPVQSF
ncbi:MAG: hypothetical protein ABI443_08510 [Chthoniobacterales bacterium]